MTSSRIRPYLILRSGVRTGLTLVEIMIALTMTLIVLGAMMTAFQFASEQMQMGRGVMEMANRLRSAEELLRNDLSNLTVDPRPYTESTNPNGYFEIIEGPRRDTNFPLTGVDAVFPFGVLDPIGILDSDGDLIPDPADIDITGGTDLDGDGVDDLFDRNLAGNSYRGDYDDIWAGTIRSEKQPFRGRYIEPNDTFTVGGNIYQTLDPTMVYTISVIESPLSEVCWWTALQDDSDFADQFEADSVQVYRRALLIRPGLTLPTFMTFADATAYLATTDISARVVTFTDSGTTLFRVVANNIKELANRQNRYCHAAYANVFNADPTIAAPRRLLNRGALWGLRSADYVVSGTGYTLERNGNDILLSDVVAFDLKVYSPDAGVGIVNGVTVEPHDFGFVSLGATSTLGAYVDLGHSGGGWFSGYATPLSQLTYQFRLDKGASPNRTGLMETVYDTWTPLYESDGLNQDGDDDGGSPAVAVIDEGTNGVNDGGTFAPDDDLERETRPPYPFPVRGVKVSIRLIENNTKQIHQSSVIHSYVPE